MNSQRNKITILTFLLIFVSFAARAEMRITNWDEKIQLTDVGKEVNLTVKAQIVNIPQGQYQSGFGIGFGTKDKMVIKNVQVDGISATNSFQNNNLSIRFPSNKLNNEQVVIKISYAVKYSEIDQYLRNEALYVPSWAAGAKAVIEVAYPWSLQSATFNPNVKEFDKQFIYYGVVPKTGMAEIVKLTNSANFWDVKIKHVINTKGNIADLVASVPIYFTNGSQKQTSYEITSDPVATMEKNNSRNIFKFKNLKEQNVTLRIGAQIYTGEHYRGTVNRTPSDYLLVNNQDKLVLSGMLDKIKQDQTMQGFPTYAKIGKFVHNYISYDRSLAGRNLNTEQIINGKRGVCAEYAKLYNAIARMAGIPSLVVNGAAFGEYKSFEGHAWNLIYYNNKWIFVDPTWDLMSGIVSSSHIYFFDNDEDNPDLKIEWRAFAGQGNVIPMPGNDFEIKKLW